MGTTPSRPDQMQSPRGLLRFVTRYLEIQIQRKWGRPLGVHPTWPWLGAKRAQQAVGQRGGGTLAVGLPFRKSRHVWPESGLALPAALWRAMPLSGLTAGGRALCHGYSLHRWALASSRLQQGSSFPLYCGAAWHCPLCCVARAVCAWFSWDQSYPPRTGSEETEHREQHLVNP